MSEASILDPAGPVVSLTTYGKRLQTVYLTIESIARGASLPSQLILWLDDVDGFNNRPASLKRLEERGLEVRLSRNFGPHGKYYPYVISKSTFDRPLVTADDDVLYNGLWLAGLLRSYRAEPTLIHCYRAHAVQLLDGAIAPYRQWEACRSREESVLNFATGVAGCIYPPRFLSVLREAGEDFLYQCPKADDVWLHVNALRAGFKIRQIGYRSMNYPFIPGTQDTGLWMSNVGLDRNDEQIARTYRSKDLRKLLVAAGHLPEVESERQMDSAEAHVAG